MRIKSMTYGNMRQKPCQYHWDGLLHITIFSASRKLPTRIIESVKSYFRLRRE